MATTPSPSADWDEASHAFDRLVHTNVAMSFRRAWRAREGGEKDGNALVANTESSKAMPNYVLFDRLDQQSRSRAAAEFIAQAQRPMHADALERLHLAQMQNRWTQTSARSVSRLLKNNRMDTLALQSTGACAQLLRSCGVKRYLWTPDQSGIVKRYDLNRKVGVERLSEVPTVLRGAYRVLCKWWCPSEHGEAMCADIVRLIVDKVHVWDHVLLLSVPCSVRDLARTEREGALTGIMCEAVFATHHASCSHEAVLSHMESQWKRCNGVLDATRRAARDVAKRVADRGCRVPGTLKRGREEDSSRGRTIVVCDEPTAVSIRKYLKQCSERNLNMRSLKSSYSPTLDVAALADVVFMRRNSLATDNPSAMLSHGVSRVLFVDAPDAWLVTTAHWHHWPCWYVMDLQRLTWQKAFEMAGGTTAGGLMRLPYRSYYATKWKHRYGATDAEEEDL
jgi:hypothetical protein